MTAILAAALMLQPEPVQGTAAFSYRIESAAENHGIPLAGLGCAVLDCDRKGEYAWVFVDGQWYGPLKVVDCTAAHHRMLWAEWNRVVDLPWSLWKHEGWHLAPVRALVTWTEPMEGVR